MNARFDSDNFRKFSLIAAMALCASFAVGATYADETNLSDSPAGTESKAAPAIMFTVDDSTSLTWYFAPEKLKSGISKLGIPYMRDTDKISDYLIKKYGNLQYLPDSEKNYIIYTDNSGNGLDENDTLPSFIDYLPGTISSSSYNPSFTPSGIDYEKALFFWRGVPEMLDSTINKLAYNPAVTYYPPSPDPNASSSSTASALSSSVCPDPKAFACMDSSHWSKVEWDPYWWGRPYPVDLENYRWNYTTAQWNAIKSDFNIPSSDYTAIEEAYPPTSTGISLPPFYFKRMCDAGYQSSDVDSSVQDCHDYIIVMDFSQGKVVPSKLTQTYYDYRAEQWIALTPRSDNDELINYANWAAYYRNRIAAMKTTASLAFSKLCNPAASTATGSARDNVCYHYPFVGIETINQLAGNNFPDRAEPSAQKMIPGMLPDTTFEDDKNHSSRTNFFTQLFKIEPLGNTPLVTALTEVGKDFKNIFSESNSPFKSCQRNYNILFTDGQWNDDMGGVPNYKDAQSDITIRHNQTATWAGTQGSLTLYGVTTNKGQSPWPNTIGNGPKNSLPNDNPLLSDASLNFWASDLSSLTNNVTPSIYLNDPATWQHINLLAIGFGVQGSDNLPTDTEQQRQNTLSQIQEGVLSWPELPLCSDDAYKNTSSCLTSASGATFDDDDEKIDDLFHAAVNGFGTYTPASSPDELEAAINQALAVAMMAGGSRANAALSSSFWDNTSSTDDKWIYLPRMGDNWTGDLLKISVKELLRASAAQDSDVELAKLYANPDESAAKNIKSLIRDTGTKDKTTGIEIIDTSGRTIYTDFGTAQSNTSSDFATFDVTSDGGNIPQANLKYLGDTQAEQNNAIKYLRGDSSREGDTTGWFRNRHGNLLGDIVHFTPQFVGAPTLCVEDTSSSSSSTAQPTLNCGVDSDELSSYENFYRNEKNRAERIYVGANDGMLHAFDKNLNEQWAYIPSNLFRSLSDGGIANLTYPVADANHPFKHYYYLDATPRVADVRTNFEAGAKDDGWATVMVGGLGKGGNAYYAINVSTPGKKPQLLWTFTDPDMGYTFGRPIITRSREFTDAQGNMKWIAILPSGYNNGKDAGSAPPHTGSGQACLFFVDLTQGRMLGKQLFKLCTNYSKASATNPLGMANIASYVDDEKSQISEYVYGGDQQGNFWRFDIHCYANQQPSCVGKAGSDWDQSRVSRLGYLLEPNNTTPQYVTTEPYPFLDKQAEATKYCHYVAVGTGGFRNTDDLYPAKAKNGDTSDRLNTMYVFRDVRADNDMEQWEGGSCGVSLNGIEYGVTKPIDRGVMAQVKNITTDPDGLSKTTDPTTLAALAKYGWYADLPANYHININPGGYSAPDGTNMVIFAANEYTLNENGNGYMDDPDSSCKKSTFQGYLFARSVRDGSSLLDGSDDSIVASTQAKKGISGFNLIREIDPKTGGYRLHFLIYQQDGTLMNLYSPDSASLPLAGGGNDDGGIPIRANIRYINTMN